MKLNKVKSIANQYYNKLGYLTKVSAPLIHPYFPMSFNMSAGFVQLEPYIKSERKIQTKKIVTVQKCIRHFDRNKTGKDHSHLTFFEMWGALTLNNSVHRHQQIKHIWTLLIDKFKINPKRLIVTCFGGDKICTKKYDKDKEMIKIWQNIEPSPKQIYLGNSDNTFWFQGGDNLNDQTKNTPFNNRICGYQTEIFFDLTEKPCSKQCNLFCECGRYLEIANNLYINWEYNLKTKKFNKLKIPATETVFGVERLTTILNNKNSVWLLDEWQHLYSTFDPYDISLENQRIIIDRFKTILFLAMEKDLPQPGHNGQRRLVKLFIRDILSRYYLIFDYKQSETNIENHLQSIATKLCYLYQNDYPKINKAVKRAIKLIIKHHKQSYANTIRHAYASIHHSKLRGEISKLTDSIKKQKRKELGIPTFLIDHFFN